MGIGAPELMILMVVLPVIGAPTFIAHTRQRTPVWTIAVGNLFVWVPFVWIVLVVLALQGDTKRSTPTWAPPAGPPREVRP